MPDGATAKPDDDEKKPDDAKKRFSNLTVDESSSDDDWVDEETRFAMIRSRMAAFGGGRRVPRPEGFPGPSPQALTRGHDSPHRPGFPQRPGFAPRPRFPHRPGFPHRRGFPQRPRFPHRRGGFPHHPMAPCNYIPAGYESSSSSDHWSFQDDDDDEEETKLFKF